MIRRIEVVSEARVSAVEQWLSEPEHREIVGEEMRRQVARVCAIHRHQPPRLNRRMTLVCAADCGTGTGQEPRQGCWAGEPVMNLLDGVAPLNNLARQVGVHLRLLDVGVAGEIPAHPSLIQRKIAWGTAPIKDGPAMGRSQAVESVLAGHDTMSEFYSTRAVDAVVVAGVNGGDDIPATLCSASLLGMSPEQVLAEPSLASSDVSRIGGSLADRDLKYADTLAMLADLGGFEVGAMAGVYLAAARHGVVAFVDGLGSAVAARLAIDLCPQVEDYLFVGHSSENSFHQRILAKLDKQRLLAFPVDGDVGVGGTIGLGVLASAVSLWGEGVPRPDVWGAPPAPERPHSSKGGYFASASDSSMGESELEDD